MTGSQSRTTIERNAVEQAAKPRRLAVLFSGGGRTLENLALASRDGRLDAEIVLAIASNGTAGGLARCERLGLPCVVIARRDFDSPESFSDVVFERVRSAGAELVCLAGWLSLLPIPEDFRGRVINIHPALLPRFGGKGMYGNRVHQAVLDSGCTETGCTVHFCDDVYDHGPIVLQRRCDVAAGDTAESLAARVFELELDAYPEAIKLIQRGHESAGRKSDS